MNIKDYLDEALSLNEMAYSRPDAIDRCASLGKKFIEHFDKIYKEPKNQAVNHWCNEMQVWYNSVKEISLKPKNKPLNGTQMRDWFYTFGSDSSVYFNDMTENDIYEEFIDKLEQCGDVKISINGLLNSDN